MYRSLWEFNPCCQGVICAQNGAITHNLMQGHVICHQSALPIVQGVLKRLFLPTQRQILCLVSLVSHPSEHHTVLVTIDSIINQRCPWLCCHSDRWTETFQKNRGISLWGGVIWRGKHLPATSKSFSLPANQQNVACYQSINRHTHVSLPTEGERWWRLCKECTRGNTALLTPQQLTLVPGIHPKSLYHKIRSQNYWTYLTTHNMEAISIPC